MAESGGKLHLRWAWLGLIVPPLIVITAAFALMWLAVPQNPLAKAGMMNGHAEAAGRLRMLATWLPLLLIGLGCIGYFFWNLRLFDRDSWKRLVGLFWLFALGGAAAVSLGLAEGPALLGEGEICAAFSAPTRLSTAKPAPAAARPATSAPAANVVIGAPDNSFADYPPGEARRAPGVFERRPCPDARGDEPMGRMWLLNLIQRLLLALVSPALVLGTIACLALPAGGDSEEACWRRLTRLKVHLYLASAVFVCGLLFLSALLRWPAFAFTGAGAAAYAAHVDAFVLYWGVTYTLYIASYYAPVALFLAQGCKAAGMAEKDLPAAQLGELGKTLIALFAPVIIALLGNVVKF